MVQCCGDIQVSLCLHLSLYTFNHSSKSICFISTKMAPKRKTTTKPATKDAKVEDSQDEKKPQHLSGDATAPAEGSKKRKQMSSSDGPQKEPRRSGRGASQSQPSQEQLLTFLLTKEAEDLCRPNEELQNIKSRGHIRTYTSVMNPFEELLCAVILSRPISHRLGLRSIRTILNDPYNFTSAKAVKNAGSKKHHQALWDASKYSIYHPDLRHDNVTREVNPRHR